ncbi:MAG: zinc-binding dehydrogenase [Rhodopirellula sp.]|nr:zinc-binding dehydrogenase [Rhodopirellula sp.]
MTSTGSSPESETTAAVLYTAGQPLVVEAGIQIPKLQPGQVLVRVAYSGVCHSQLMEVRGKHGEDRFLPHMLGHEGSGTVLAVGGEVSKVVPGDRVVLTWIKGTGCDVQGSRYKKAGVTINAGGVTTFNRHAVVSENRCVKLPEGFPMDLASLLGCAVPTGAGMVINTMRPTRENTIAIFGLGGIGSSALLGAKLCECSTIIAVDIEKRKLEMAESLGATHVIDATHTDPVEGIRSIVGSGGVDFAAEAAGRTQTIEQAFESVRTNGGLCVFASHPPAGEKISIDPHQLISGKRIMGSWGGDSKPDTDIPLYADKYKRGLLPLEKLVTHRFPLDDINEALSLLESGQAGRILLEIAPDED